MRMRGDRYRWAGGLFMLVGGWPGSGKSTLAAALAAELGLRLLAKDEIKEALMDSLGVPPTVAESRRLGIAAVHAMLASLTATPAPFSTAPGLTTHSRSCASCPAHWSRSPASFPGIWPRPLPHARRGPPSRPPG